MYLPILSSIRPSRRLSRLSLGQNEFDKVSHVSQEFSDQSRLIFGVTNDQMTYTITSQISLYIYISWRKNTGNLWKIKLFTGDMRAVGVENRLKMCHRHFRIWLVYSKLIIILRICWSVYIEIPEFGVFSLCNV